MAYRCGTCSYQLSLCTANCTASCSSTVPMLPIVLVYPWYSYWTSRHCKDNMHPFPVLHMGGENLSLQPPSSNITPEDEVLYRSESWALAAVHQDEHICPLGVQKSPIWSTSESCGSTSVWGTGKCCYWGCWQLRLIKKGSAVVLYSEHRVEKLLGRWWREGEGGKYCRRESKAHTTHIRVFKKRG